MSASARKGAKPPPPSTGDNELLSLIHEIETTCVNWLSQSVLPSSFFNPGEKHIQFTALLSHNTKKKKQNPQLFYAQPPPEHRARLEKHQARLQRLQPVMDALRGLNEFSRPKRHASTVNLVNILFDMGSDRTSERGEAVDYVLRRLVKGMGSGSITCVTYSVALAAILFKCRWIHISEVWHLAEQELVITGGMKSKGSSRTTLRSYTWGRIFVGASTVLCKRMLSGESLHALTRNLIGLTQEPTAYTTSCVSVIFTYLFEQTSSEQIAKTLFPALKHVLVRPETWGATELTIALVIRSKMKGKKANSEGMTRELLDLLQLNLHSPALLTKIAPNVVRTAGRTYPLQHPIWRIMFSDISEERDGQHQIETVLSVFIQRLPNVHLPGKKKLEFQKQLMAFILAAVFKIPDEHTRNEILLKVYAMLPSLTEAQLLVLRKQPLHNQTDLDYDLYLRQIRDVATIVRSKQEEDMEKDNSVQSGDQLHQKKRKRKKRQKTSKLHVGWRTCTQRFLLSKLRDIGKAHAAQNQHQQCGNVAVNLASLSLFHSNTPTSQMVLQEGDLTEVVINDAFDYFVTLLHTATQPLIPQFHMKPNKGNNSAPPLINYSALPCLYDVVEMIHLNEEQYDTYYPKVDTVSALSEARAAIFNVLKSVKSSAIPKTNKGAPPLLLSHYLLLLGLAYIYLTVFADTGLVESFQELAQYFEDHKVKILQATRGQIDADTTVLVDLVLSILGYGVNKLDNKYHSTVHILNIMKQVSMQLFKDCSKSVNLEGATLLIEAFTKAAEGLDVDDNDEEDEEEEEEETDGPHPTSTDEEKEPPSKKRKNNDGTLAQHTSTPFTADDPMAGTEVDVSLLNDIQTDDLSDDDETDLKPTAKPTEEATSSLQLKVLDMLTMYVHSKAVTHSPLLPLCAHKLYDALCQSDRITGEGTVSVFYKATPLLLQLSKTKPRPSDNTAENENMKTSLKELLVVTTDQLKDVKHLLEGKSKSRHRKRKKDVQLNTLRSTKHVHIFETGLKLFLWAADLLVKHFSEEACSVGTVISSMFGSGSVNYHIVDSLLNTLQNQNYKPFFLNGILPSLIEVLTSPSPSTKSRNKVITVNTITTILWRLRHDIKEEDRHSYITTILPVLQWSDMTMKQKQEILTCTFRLQSLAKYWKLEDKNGEFNEVLTGLGRVSKSKVKRIGKKNRQEREKEKKAATGEADESKDEEAAPKTAKPAKKPKGQKRNRIPQEAAEAMKRSHPSSKKRKVVKKVVKRKQ